MASKADTPYIPRLEMVKVPVVYSSGVSFFSCAFFTSSRHLPPRETMSILFAFLRVGVMSPPSKATAMATLMSGGRWVGGWVGGMSMRHLSA